MTGNANHFIFMTCLPPSVRNFLLIATGIVSGLNALEAAPLDIAQVARVEEWSSRAGVDLSPDGTWLAATASTVDQPPGDPRYFTATGLPLTEGYNGQAAQLVEITTGRSVRLGGGKCNTWWPVWSPDGKRLAYYSDEGGEAGLWVWDRATESSRRVGRFAVRPFFGFQKIRWFADGLRVICPVVPEGKTIRELNHAQKNVGGTGRFPPVPPGQPSVLVFRSGLDEPQKTAASATEETAAYLADLAVIDTDTGSLQRVLVGQKPRVFTLSPDQKWIACTAHVDPPAGSIQSRFSLWFIPLASSADAPREVRNLFLGYGLEFSWSPDGTRVALLLGTFPAKGEPLVVSLDGKVTSLGQPGLPPLGNRSRVPLWEKSGESFLALDGDGKLWRVPADPSRTAQVVASDPAHPLVGIVHNYRDGVPAASEGEDCCYAITGSQNGAENGIARVDLKTGRCEMVIERAIRITTDHAFDPELARGVIAFDVQDQKHPSEFWLFDVRSRGFRQVTHLTPQFENVQLGEARSIEWTNGLGQKSDGVLLLPPGYQAGSRCPLVVVVYGGTPAYNFRPSLYINTFGLGGGSPEFDYQVLATRGYAVFYPDLPLRTGRTREDMGVMLNPAIDAVVAAGYADPGRLAVMGQSYGSYCVLSALTLMNRFKAAVITGAVVHPDLVANYLSLNSDGVYDATDGTEHGQLSLGGSLWEARDAYLQSSPIYFFDRITAPLLIGQGAIDGRLIASDATFVALRRLKKPVEYRIYEGEGHVLVRPENVIDFWERRLAFLAEHLDIQLDAQGAVVFDGDRARSRSAHLVQQ